MNILVVAVVAMLVQQSFATLGKTVVPVAAPEVAAALSVSPALVGVFVALTSVASLATTMTCNPYIVRYGGLRISQVGLVLMAVGIAAAAVGSLTFFVISALLTGCGTSLSTPASSQILHRYAPPRYAPLVFSIKQTGVPVGSMMAGFLIPFFILTVGWQAGFLIIALMCLVLAVLLQPSRAEFDRDRQPGYKLSPKAAKTTFLAVMGTRGLRRLAIATFAFVGLQSVFVAFFVTYLVTELGHPITVAGPVFSTAMATAIFARILWGWVGSRLETPRLVLAALGISMGIASAALALYTREWPIWMITGAAVLFCATAVSWHGVLLAEVARLSPAGMVGGMTGGVLSFGNAGQIVFPLAFGALLNLSGSYALGFLVAGIPGLIAGIMFLRPLSGSTGSADAPVQAA